MTSHNSHHAAKVACVLKILLLAITNCVWEAGMNRPIRAYLKQMPLMSQGVFNLLILTRVGTLNAKHQYCTE